MKLIRAHISAFGKFHNRSFEFDKPFLSYCEENGFGKSTLVAFLTAMLYGMETVKRNVAGKLKDRTHYQPFEGGNYGGSLTLVVGGDTYSIERTFDVKSDTADDIVLRKEGTKIDTPPLPLGEYFFGLDRDSFRKSILLDSEDVTISSTGSIAGKLENDVDDTSDINNYESAHKKLEETAKKYKLMRGRGGYIDDLSSRLAEVKGQIHNLETIEAALPGKYADRDNIESLIRADEEKHKAILSISGLEANRKTLSQYQEEANASKAALTAKKEEHPLGYPDANELASLETLGQKQNAARITLEAKSLSAEEENSLSSYKKMFEKGLPEEGALKETEEKISRYLSLGKEEKAPFGEGKNRLLAKFKYREPKEEDIAHYEGELANYKELGARLSALPKTVIKKEERETEAISSKPKSLVVIAFVLSAILLGTGIALCFFALMVGIVLLIVGAATLGGSVFLALSKTKSRLTSYVDVEKENPEIAPLEKKRSEIQANIEAFLAPFDYRRENGIEANFALFKADFARYLDLCKDIKEDEEKKAAFEKERAILAKEIASFLAAYGLHGNDFKSLLDTLRSALPAFDALAKKKDDFDAAKKEGEQAEDNYRIALAALQKKYQWAFTLVEEVRSFDVAVKLAQKDHDEKKARLENFAKEHPGLEGAAIDFDETAEQVDERLTSLRKRKSLLEGEIKSDEKDVDGLDSLRAEAEELLEDIDKAKKEYEILSSAAKFLEEAKDSQNNKYLSPIRKSFDKYASQLDSVLGGKIEIDRSFAVTLVENGKSHDEGHLSSGQRSLVMFCLRLALLENMFQAETPLLILDDPFIHLDDAHMDLLKTALPKMLAQWQVLYFCCSESKKI